MGSAKPPTLLRASTSLFLLFLPLLLHSSFTAATNTSCSSSKPFTLPFTTCTFPSGTSSTFGILVEVGGPTAPQRLCLAPSTVMNSTLLAVDSLCGSTSSRACEAIRGGLFDKSQSSTWTDVALSQFNGSREETTWAHFNPPGITEVGYDTLHLPGGGDQVTLYGYGFSLNVHGTASTMGMLGLGTESLFLNQAVANNFAPSRSWSLDVGSQSVALPRDGELVVGGYNKGRKDGSFVWQNISDMSGDRPCPLRTSIKEMSIILEDGTEKPLFSSSETLEACIEPYDTLFRLPSTVLSTFKSLTRFSPNTSAPTNLTYSEPGLLYPTSELPNKYALTITLSNGYKTSIPQYEMQQPLRGWDANGAREEVGNLTNVAIFETPAKDGEVSVLGKVFLSQSLLTVDYSAGQFALAPSKQPPGSAELATFPCTSTLPPPARNTTTPPPAPPKSSNASAIIGGAVGVPMLLGILALAFVLWRKHCRKPAEGQVEVGGFKGGFGEEGGGGRIVSFRGWDGWERPRSQRVSMGNAPELAGGDARNELGAPV